MILELFSIIFEFQVKKRNFENFPPRQRSNPSQQLAPQTVPFFSSPQNFTLSNISITNPPGVPRTTPRGDQETMDKHRIEESLLPGHDVTTFGPGDRVMAPFSIRVFHPCPTRRNDSSPIPFRLFLHFRRLHRASTKPPEYVHPFRESISNETVLSFLFFSSFLFFFSFFHPR